MSLPSSPRSPWREYAIVIWVFGGLALMLLVALPGAYAVGLLLRGTGWLDGASPERRIDLLKAQIVHDWTVATGQPPDGVECFTNSKPVSELEVGERFTCTVFFLRTTETVTVRVVDEPPYFVYELPETDPPGTET